MAEVSSVEQHKSYGWGFFTTFEDCSFENVVNPIQPDEWWLTVSMSGYLIRKLTLRNPRRTFDRYCDVIAGVLGQVPEFSNPKWNDHVS